MSLIKIVKSTAIFIWLAMVLSPAGAGAAPSNFPAKVIHVDDGDTVIALRHDMTRTKVRLASIDAPETSHGRCKPGQPYSQQSTALLKQLVLGKEVAVQCHEEDRRGRLVCDLVLGNTTASRELVGAGLAWANRANPKYLRDPVVGALEAQARSQNLGLWASSPPATPPWLWRRTHWMQPGCQA